MLFRSIADRTKSRFGKFRPYLLWAGIPLAAAGVLTFTTPDLDSQGKLVWAYLTYTMMMLMYTVLSTPYSSLSAVMTAQSEERTSLISIRFLFAFSCGALVNKFTLPLVAYFGQGDDAQGWQYVMMLYGLLSIVIFLITFVSTRERIQPPADQLTRPQDDIVELLGNKPWLVLFVLAMVIMMTITMRAGSAFYFFTYYVERPDLLSDYLFVQMVAYAAGALLAPVLVRYIDKTKLLKILMATVGALSILFYFVPKDMIWAMFTLNILISLALGPKSPLTWSMYADSADYNEWRTGNRATAMTFSAATFSQKLGGALGASGMLWVLAFLGYTANQMQSGASLEGINMLQTIVPGVFALFSVWVVGFYSLDSQRLDSIQDDLRRRSDEYQSNRVVYE